MGFTSFQNFNLGDFVEFVGESKTYETMVTQLSFKNGFYSCSVILGEYRVKLTDKSNSIECSRLLFSSSL